MKLFLALLFAAMAAPLCHGAPPDRVVIHLLDPRGEFAGEETMPTQWQNREADVIGRRVLNIAEAKRLRALLRQELADDDNVPFCGHSPAYAVSITPPGKKTTTVTLCGTCGTWAKAGELRSLHGRAALEYLDQLLPLPDVFRPADGHLPEILAPFGERDSRSFADLD
ncbi:hypothetical protein [Allorhodopirellula heiligendammensis]|uniref:Uncharacterized protein n=1 Tax=Allorhodopirellula heiligendammensis TaxID=2714739 RepID=A0A5C6CA05_9BACT|nr:hypothetical protein [Allorhodopirellula heiligendammensis]TWU19599.1 hypothetical protein Poly21_17740 [Allorhodopirellula heiligendammensis]